MPTIVSARNRRLKCMPFGEPGSGKTTWACGAQDHPDMSPVLVIDSDDGLLSVAARGDIAAEECRTIAQYEVILGKIASGDPVFKEFKTIITDSGSDLLTKAEGAKTPKERDQFYVSAALKASQGDDPEQAMSIIQKVSNPQMQESLGTVIRMQVAMRAISKDDFDMGYRVAKDIPNLSQRSMVFGMLANKLVEKKDMVRAREFLSDAETSVLKAIDGTDKANALLQIASIMVRVDAIRAFDTMRSAVDAVNHSTFTDPNAGNPTNNGGLTFVSFGTNTFNFDGALTPLARNDFQKSLLLAQAIEMKEASTLAQISVCRGVLVKSAEQNASEKADKEEKEKKDETVKPKPDEKKEALKKPF